MTRADSEAGAASRAEAAKTRMNTAFERLEQAIRRSILREARATLDVINATENVMQLAPQQVVEAEAEKEPRRATRSRQPKAQDSLGNVKNLFDE